MENKAALFAFNGDAQCFVHVLLNAFDLRERGWEVRIVIEGTATKLVKLLHEDQTQPFAALYAKAREQGLIDCVCRACANKTGALQSALDQGIEACDEMNGHPSVGRYLEAGYQVLTF
ncbi:MAG: hypothetical protein P9M14_05830 [Candidatus Alcyoniella australis]|nr:hypothetical protein [Candidatus Alcyoniella australis]